MAEDKGNKPSKRQLEKARRRGKVLKSQLLTQLVALVSVSFAILVFLRSTSVKNRMLLEYCWSEGLLRPQVCALEMGGVLLGAVLGSLIFAALVSIIAEGLQGGFRFDAALLAPRSTIFDVSAGFKRIASGLRNSWQSMLRLLVFSLVFAWVYSDIVRLCGSLIHLSWTLQVKRSAEFLVREGAIFGLVLFALAGIEYLVRRRSFFRELSMSVADLRQEQKEEEGDPNVRSLQRRLQRAMTFDELVERTRKSRVIIVEESK